jgi:hypothetical protein
MIRCLPLSAVLLMSSISPAQHEHLLEHVIEVLT